MPKYILGREARARFDAARYGLSIGGLLLLLSVIEVSLLGRLVRFGALPDLMICAVLGLSYFCGKYVGAVTGIAAGLLIELIGSQGVILLPVFYMLLGYLAGHFARTAVGKRFPTYLIYLGVTLLYRAALTILYASLTHDRFRLPTVLLYSVLPEMIGTAIAGAALYVPLLLLCRWLEGRPKRIKRS